MRRRGHSHNAIAAVLAALVSARCSGRSAATATTPSGLGPSTTPPSGGSPIPGLAVSGTVLTTSREGTFPLANSRVDFVGEHGAGSVTPDGAGRYVIPNLVEGERVHLVAFATPPLRLFQRSAFIALVNVDTRVDIELVSDGFLGISFDSPSLSGTIYRDTPDGRKPQARTRVFFKSFDGPGYDAYQESDAEGRFAFGRLPEGAGRLGVGNCNDQALLVAVDIRGDTVTDVDITQFVATCPGVFF
jgi:hypothetical protein